MVKITTAFLQVDPELSCPVHPRGIVQMFRARGHQVTMRVNRNGSHRYSVDGKPETNAYAMTRRYERFYGG